jgi:hypothetical protein
VYYKGVFDFEQEQTEQTEADRKGISTQRRSAAEPQPKEFKRKVAKNAKMQSRSKIMWGKII